MNLNKLNIDIVTDDHENEVVEKKYAKFGYFDLLNINFEELYSEAYFQFDHTIFCSVKDVIDDNRLKALLLEMRIRMAKPIGAIKRLKRELDASITLLFGFCSSQTSFIFRAFNCTSHFRTISL